MMRVRSLGNSRFPGMQLPAGQVVVEAPFWVAPLLWMPVFMYASLLKHTYRKSCPRSMAPDRDWKPMSYVAPSPPKAMNLTSWSSLPWRFSELYAASTPLMVAGAFSKAVCIHGTFQEVNGYMLVETSKHPVALATTTGLSVAMSTWRAMIGSAQPAQRRCPSTSRSSVWLSCFRFKASPPGS